MITDKLIKECQAFDKSEYDEDTPYDAVKRQLEALESRGCVVENIRHCPNCPKFGKSCPIV